MKILINRESSILDRVNFLCKVIKTIYYLKNFHFLVFYSKRENKNHEN